MNNIAKASATIREYALSIKQDLFRPANGILRNPYLSAGIGDTYPDLTDWDAVWAGIGYLGYGDPAPLKASLLNLIEHIAPDGKGQRRIGIETYSALPYQIRPFLVSGCYALSKAIGCDWLSIADCERLHHSLMYWHINRTGREGLLKWIHVDEGFADNGLANWAWEANAVQGTDLNAQMVREHLGLAWILEQKEMNSYAEAHREWATRLIHRINTCLWNEKTGSYFSLYNPPERERPSEPITVLHYTNLWPLWVGIAGQDQAQRVIEQHILNEDEFLSPIGIRSMAKSERNFNNMKTGYINHMSGTPHAGPVFLSGSANWQGPVWPVPVWLCVMAMSRYGYKDEAKTLAGDYICWMGERLEKYGLFHENYHSETGEPLAAAGMGSWYVLIPEILKLEDTDLFPACTQQ